MRKVILSLLAYSMVFPAFAQVVEKASPTLVTVTKEVTETKPLDDYIAQKAGIEQSIAVAQSNIVNIQARIAILQKELDEVDTIIADAERAGVKTEKELAVEEQQKAAAESLATFQANAKKVYDSMIKANTGVSGDTTVEP